jgi:ATP-binding protein involved in chromosome partitioning
MLLTPETVLHALRSVIDPHSNKDLVRLGWIRKLEVSETEVSFTVVLDNPASEFAGAVEALCRAAIRDVAPDVSIAVSLDSEMIGLDAPVAGGVAEPPEGIRKVRNIVAVASGKGGVGKSTVAVNLAVALARSGYDVGLVDTDMYGPSIPTMFGVQDERPRVDEARRIIPVERFGVRLLSMGFLVDDDRAVIWRGPMVSGAVRQFLGETAWGELDYLIMDLPPGTGDIQLTIVQTVPLTGAIIVSTPQNVALADARKGVAMFQQVDVPVLGIVENMAYFTPPDLPDRKYFLFGEGGAARLAAELGVPVLGEIPIDQSLREHCDAGDPLTNANPESETAIAFANLAVEVDRQVALRNAGLEPVAVTFEYR